MWKINPNSKRVEGICLGRKLSIPETWSNHTFTPEELDDLFNGKTIKVTTTSKKNGKVFTAKLHIDPEAQFGKLIPEFGQGRPNNSTNPSNNSPDTNVPQNPAPTSNPTANPASRLGPPPNNQNSNGFSTPDKSQPGGLSYKNHTFTDAEWAVLFFGGIVAFTAEDNSLYTVRINSDKNVVVKNAIEEVDLFV